ncbi:hypothetical protein TNIN_423911 [Trichonephila inaurata madagascariensis]|uniref:Uncharacterized protein n=1 Tax=Trichonephila inaurata madagascariensis TaxID=2747483 RepID=A0A8X6K7L5_9ARAC|nr:hypothetical protein TNIN_423911 [Trichonephila inaurata madagascariensis]
MIPFKWSINRAAGSCHIISIIRLKFGDNLEQIRLPSQNAGSKVDRQIIGSVGDLRRHDGFRDLSPFPTFLLAIPSSRFSFIALVEFY